MKAIQIDFDKMGGLIPAVIQDYKSGEVLMVAFMDRKTLDMTLDTGKTWFFSRTRNKYWMKGEESGNTQEVMEVLTDCDADSVVIKVRQNGPAACHTGNRSCFYSSGKRQWVNTPTLCSIRRRSTRNEYRTALRHSERQPGGGHN